MIVESHKEKTNLSKRQLEEWIHDETFNIDVCVDEMWAKEEREDNESGEGLFTEYFSANDFESRLFVLFHYFKKYNICH